MIIGIILAGGKSSRMGQNKALLPYRGLPLIEHMEKILRDANISSIYVSGELDGYSCIPDSVTNLGPVGGIYSVLNYFGPTKNKYLIVPVDMPLLKSSLITTLVHSNYPDQARYFKDYYLPMLLPDTENLRKILNKELENCAIKNLLRAIHAEIIPPPLQELNCFSNINTPSELARISS